MARASLLWLLVVGVTVVAATGEPGITTNDGAMIIEADAVTVTTPNGDYTIGHADAQAEAAHERIDAVNASLKRAEQVAEESNLRLEATRADLQKVNASALANSAVNGQLASSVDALNASLEALVHSAGTTSQALSDRLDAVNASLKRAEETAEERNLRLEAIMADLQEVNASSLANSAVNGQLASSVDALNTSLEALVHSAAMTNQTLSNRLDAVNADIHALNATTDRMAQCARSDGIYNADTDDCVILKRREADASTAPFTRHRCQVPEWNEITQTGTMSYTFTPYDCGGVLPMGDCDGMMKRNKHCGSDEDFRINLCVFAPRPICLPPDSPVLLVGLINCLPDPPSPCHRPTPTAGPSMVWWVGSACGAPSIEVIFYCYNNVPAPATAYGVANRLENEYFTRTLCHVPAGYDSSSDTHDYTFTASDCRGVYPTGDCDGFLVRASQSGSDQDFQVFTPATSGNNQPRVSWYTGGSSSNPPDVSALYYCYKKSPPWERVNCRVTNLPRTESSNSKSSRNLKPEHDIWPTLDTFTAADCGGSLPQGTNCDSFLVEAAQNGPDEDWGVAGPEDGVAPTLTWYNTLHNYALSASVNVYCYDNLVA